jgi:hypothetical protein
MSYGLKECSPYLCGLVFPPYSPLLRTALFMLATLRISALGFFF